VRGRYVLALAAVFLALVSYYLIFESAEDPGLKQTQKRILLFSLAPWDVKALRVVTFDGRELFCERKGESWRLWKGTQTENVQSTVEDFLTALFTTQQIDRFAAQGQSMGDFGLDTPSHIITVTDRTDKDYQLRLGETSPTGACTYAQFAESPDILVVGALLEWEVQKVEPLLAASPMP